MGVPDQDVAGSRAEARGGIFRHTLHATWHRAELLDWADIVQYAVAADHRIDVGLPLQGEAQSWLDAVTFQVNDAKELSASFAVASDDWRAERGGACGSHVMTEAEAVESEVREAASPCDKGTGRAVEARMALKEVSR